MDVLSQAEDGVALLHDGKFIYLNQQYLKIFGYQDASQLIGKPLHIHYADSENQWFERYVMPQFIKVGSWRGTRRARKADNSYFDEDACLKKLSNGNMAIFCRDVTAINNVERKSLFNLRLQNNLSEIEERLLLFTSHELRTPLGGIGLLTDYISKYGEELTQEEIIKLVRDISNYVMDFRDLLERFRVFKSTQETVRYVQTEQFDLASMVGEISKLLTSQLKKDIHIQIQTDGVMQVSSDRTIYKHILQNLISNALKYSEEPSLVKITLHNDGNFMHLTIADEGIGIPEDEQDKILEFMYRASNSEIATGSGVGLSLVKQCVETLRGTISMSSQEGLGTTFRIILPLNHNSLSPSKKHG